MTKRVVTIEAGKSVFEAAELMSEKGIGCLVITERGLPAGIVTERDIVRRVVAERASLDTAVSQIMSKNLVTIDPDARSKTRRG